MLATVLQDPGIHVAEIADRTALSWHAVGHHLAVLRRAGAVTFHKDGRERAVFPKGVPRRRRGWLVAMRDPQARQVLRVLLGDPTLNAPAISRRLGCTVKVVRTRLRMLRKGGVLDRRGRWRPTYDIKDEDARTLTALLSGMDPARQRPVQASWDWHPESGAVTMSAGGAGICGLSQRTVSLAAYLDGVDPQDRPALLAGLDHAAATASPYDVTVRMGTPPGVRYVRHRGEGTAPGAGGSTRVSGTIEDVSSIVVYGTRPAKGAAPA